MQQLQVPLKKWLFQTVSAHCHLFSSKVFFPAFLFPTPRFFFSMMDEIPALLCEVDQPKLEQDIEVSMKNTYLMAFPSTSTIA